MKIVIDTNVVISGTFFGGAPRRVIESVGKNGIHACATPEIIEEYEEIVEEMIDRKQGHIRRDVLAPFIAGLCTGSFHCGTGIDCSKDKGRGKQGSG